MSSFYPKERKKDCLQSLCVWGGEGDKESYVFLEKLFRSRFPPSTHGGVAAFPADQAPQTSVESSQSWGGWRGFHGCWQFCFPYTLTRCNIFSSRLWHLCRFVQVHRQKSRHSTQQACVCMCVCKREKERGKTNVIVRVCA